MSDRAVVHGYLHGRECENLGRVEEQARPSIAGSQGSKPFRRAATPKIDTAKPDLVTSSNWTKLDWVILAQLSVHLAVSTLPWLSMIGPHYDWGRFSCSSWLPFLFVERPEVVKITHVALFIERNHAI
jgi:hypothetical protein